MSIAVYGASVCVDRYCSIVCRFGSAFDFETVYTGFYKLGNMFNKAHITGIHDVSACIILLNGKIFAGTLFLHKGILIPARLGAGTAVGVTAGHVVAQQAAAGIADAHGAMAEGFNLQLGINLSADFPDFFQIQDTIGAMINDIHLMFEADASVDIDLDEAVGKAIIKLNHYKNRLGECAAEGHIIMGTDKKGDKVKVYILEQFSTYGFENGWFLEQSGHSLSGVMTFRETEEGYIFLDAEYPRAGSLLSGDIKRMFPKIYEKRAEIIYNSRELNTYFSSFLLTNKLFFHIII